VAGLWEIRHCKSPCGPREKEKPGLSEVPTLLELGYDFSNDTIHGLVGPAGLSPAVRKTLEEAFRKGMETPEFKTAQKNLNLTPLYLSGEAYEKHLRERWSKLEKTMREAGIIKGAATNPE